VTLTKYFVIMTAAPSPARFRQEATMARRHLAGIFTMALLLPAGAGGQERRQAGGPPPYDSSRETTTTGTIVRDFTIPAGPQRELAILTIAAASGTVHLILAPPDVVRKQKFVFTKGAPVEVKGIPGHHVNGEPAIMTRVVKSGKNTLTIRDETGKPTWEWPKPAGGSPAAR
jgi:hypothetical protein